MNRQFGFQQNRSRPAWASLALTAALLGLGLVLTAGLVYAQTGSISGTITYYGGIHGAHDISVAAHLDPGQPPVAGVNITSPGGPYIIGFLPDDTYYVSAYLDANDSGGPPNEDEPIAWYDADGDGAPDPVVVSGGGAVTGIDIDFGGPWLPLGGPSVEGGQVLGLAVHPTISGTVYAAVSPPYTHDSGPTVIYKSTDGAATWTAVYTTERQVYSLAVTGTQVYAGAFNPGGEGPSIYASYDSGVSWAPVFTSTDRGVWLDISVHPTDTDVAIIGGWFHHGPDQQIQNGLVYRTDDAGATWTPILTATFADNTAALNAVLIHPVTPTLMLASAHAWDGANPEDSYIFRSEDGGATWPISVTMPNAHVVSLAANTAQPDMLYAGAGFGRFSEGRAAVFRSTDAGLSWDEVHSEGTYLAFAPPGTVYTVMDTGQAYASDADGDPGTWYGIGGIWDNAYTLDADLGPAPAALYAGSPRNGVFKGADDGGGWNWDRYNTGIETLVAPSDIEAVPQNPDKLLAIVECVGGWMTTDGGQTWPQMSDGCWHGLDINPENPDIVYVGQSGCAGGTVLRSEDGGLSFTEVYTPAFFQPDCSGGDEAVQTVATAPSMTSTVYAAGGDRPDWSDWQATVVRSLDDGATWNEVFTLTERSYVNVLSIDPTDADVVYIGGEDCHTGPCEGFVYRTTDGGDTWEQTLVTSNTVWSIVVDYQKPNVLYAATGGPYDVYKSTDGGDTWTLIRSNNPPFEQPSGNRLAIDPHVPSHVYLGGWGYIAETFDGGQTWSEWGDPINQGTPPMEPRALTVDYETMTQTLYAGFTGAWSYSRPAPQPGEPATITMWTEPISGVVYANGEDFAGFHGLVVDPYENWVANGTPLTVTCAWHLGDDQDELDLFKSTSDGQIQDGFVGPTAAGVFTFTARTANMVTATVSVQVLYNPPAGISVDAAPDSIGTGGVTAMVTATVPGLHGGVASAGTEVTFETSLGTIDATALTNRGVATATLTSGNEAGTAVITATTDGFQATTTVEITGFYVYLPLVVKDN